MRRICILFLILLYSCSDFDQDIYFEYSVDTTNVEIGYPLHLDIDIKNLDNDYKILEQGWADSSLWIADSSMVIIKSSNIDSLDDSYNIDFEITFWDTGRTIIPPYFIMISPNDSIESKTYNTDYIKINIQSALSNDELSDIKPDKPIREIDLPYSYERISALFFIIILLFFIAYIWSSRNKSKRFLQKVFFNYNPREDAIKEIKKVKLDSLSNKEFYESLSNILKKFIENEYYIIAHEMTSVELNNFFQDKNLYDLLDHIDSVKFANKEYALSERKKDLELAKKFVRKLL
ncbi:MAG: hypothetical protein VYE63_02870 [Candidatus Neomarinimicrobiota bacterium]|nr:hypothetical protein [Candidatus Neomarinimicrobiota bacterium]